VGYRRRRHGKCGLSRAAIRQRIGLQLLEATAHRREPASPRQTIKSAARHDFIAGLLGCAKEAYDRL
jgi:hypothetical protein